MTFADGGTASGSFTYDPTTNTYSNINITTTAGTTLTTGRTYNFLEAVSLGGGGNAALVTFTNTNNSATIQGAFQLIFEFQPHLGSSSGTVALNGIDENGPCGDPECAVFIGTERRISGGSLVGVAITAAPAISTAGMVGLAVLLAGFALLALRPAQQKA